MILDGHVHIWEGEVNQAKLLRRMHAAGIDGGIMFSQAPASFSGAMQAGSPQTRLENLMEWCKGSPELRPFFRIDPMETDAVAQVRMAVDRGVTGFKVICDHFYPGDEQAMRTFRAISAAGKPIMFHSGILWDGKASAKYNRPGNFEAMLDIPGIRFSLAHISWPWVDECIAVYGKLNAARRRNGKDVEMFIDTTPGTPNLYRRDALTKIFTVGYDVANNVLFGSDCTAGRYDPDYAGMWVKRDKAILSELGVAAEVVENVFANNVLRLVGEKS